MGSNRVTPDLKFTPTIEMLKQFGVGRRPIHDPFFTESYKACKVWKREGVLTEAKEESSDEDTSEFTCNAPGCDATFKTVYDFEMHYNTVHQFVCAECNAIRCNSRSLDIHIEETHNIFFKALSRKQPMYQCYISECKLKFDGRVVRKRHCFKVHKFPKDFPFENPLLHKVHNSNKDEMDIDPPNDTCDKEKMEIEFNKNRKNVMFTKSKNKMYILPETSKVTQIVPPRKTKSPLIFIPRPVQISYAKVLSKNKNRERTDLQSKRSPKYQIVESTVKQILI